MREPNKAVGKVSARQEKRTLDSLRLLIRGNVLFQFLPVWVVRLFLQKLLIFLGSFGFYSRAIVKEQPGRKWASAIPKGSSFSASDK